MPLRVLYFAWIKEKVGAGEEMVSPPGEVATAQDLISWLITTSPTHADAFADCSQIRVAIDQVHSDINSPIENALEVAFFPPVTGG